MTAYDCLMYLLEMTGGARGASAALGSADRRMVQRWAKGREIPDQHGRNIKDTYRRILRERLERKVTA